MKNVTEQGTLRITTWNNSTIRITDCEFAGKRGKVCKTISIQISANEHGEQGQRFCDAVHNLVSPKFGNMKLEDVKTWDEAVFWAEAVECLLPSGNTIGNTPKEEHEGRTCRVDLYTSEEKAVRVAPCGYEELTFGNENYSASVAWEDFCFSDLTDQANCPRYIDISGRTKKAEYKKIYKFVQENMDKLNAADVSFWDAIKMIDEGVGGFSGHHYCAMD